MVMLKKVCLAMFGIASILTALPDRVDACSRPDLLGRVKSVIVTESLVDPVSGKIGEARLVSRTEVSKDGSAAEMTFYSPDHPDRSTSKSTTYFEDGRVTHGLEVADGKTVSTTNCRYDTQGRLVEARTQSVNGELSRVQLYEYGVGFIRRRDRMFGGPSVTTQTLDSSGRVVKEVVTSDATSTVVQTSEFTYNGDRTEQCMVSAPDARRHCSVVVRDSHGNETEMLGEGQSRKTSFDYDPVGNWVSQRTSVTGPGDSAKVENIVKRKIEYW